MRSAVITPRLTYCAVTHSGVFERLKDRAASFEALRTQCGLAERGAVVLLQHYDALKLLTRNANGDLQLTEHHANI